ncbi:MAG: oxaloacetate decarboxylase, partial [Bacteroidales bacterium]|nr:oxaloacetate decarboxylase [Bacteroidales bacterium]
ALMNVLQLEKGRERWSMIADNIWDMMLGKSGKLAGELAPELVEMAKKQGREFYTGNPQDLYPDQLDQYREEMKKNNWEFGQDDEELFELAMHPEQYRAYKSGEAKRAFEADLEKKRAKKEASTATAEKTPAGNTDFQPRTMVINVDNEQYVVNVSYPESGNDTHQPVQAPVSQATPAAPAPQAAPVAASSSNGATKEVISPLEGKFFLTKDSSEKAVKVGDRVNEGDIIGYIESMKTYNAVAAEESGKVTEICFANGDPVDEDDVLIKMA